MKIPSARDLNPMVVGIMSLVAVATVVAAAFGVGTLGIFKDTYQMSGVFTDSGGVKTGAKVRVAGVNVGEVTGVEPDFQTGQVVLTWEVDKGIDLGPDTRAEIAPANLLGGYYVKLSGPVVEPYMASLPADRRRIPLDHTVAPESIIQGLGASTRQIQKLDVKSLNNVVHEISDAVGHNQDAFPALVENLGKLAAAVNQRKQELSGLVANAQQAGATLHARDQQLADLIDKSSGLLDVLTARRDELATVLGAGSDAVTKLSDVIAGHRQELFDLTQDSHTVLEAVERNLPTVNTALAWAGPTFDLLLAATDPKSGLLNVNVQALTVLSPNWLSQLLGLGVSQ